MTLFADIIFFCIVILSSTAVYFYISYQQLKTNEKVKFNSLISEISFEEKTAISLKHQSKKIEYLEKSIEKKLRRLKVAFLDLDFTLSEIFN
jgi:hypothetical protein